MLFSSSFEYFVCRNNLDKTHEMVTPKGGTIDANTFTASGSCTPSKSIPSANNEATLLTGPPKSKAAIPPTIDPKRNFPEPCSPCKKSVIASVAQTIGTPTTKNINKPILRVANSGMIIIGINPCAHLGTLRYFTNNRTKNPTK